MYILDHATTHDTRIMTLDSSGGKAQQWQSTFVVAVYILTARRKTFAATRARFRPFVSTFVSSMPDTLNDLKQEKLLRELEGISGTYSRCQGFGDSSSGVSFAVARWAWPVRRLCSLLSISGHAH